MQARAQRVLVAIGLIGVLAGCASLAPSVEPGASAGAVEEICPSVELRTPGGDELDLSGRWQANDFGEYFLSQRLSCVHWLGMSPSIDDKTPAGSWWTQVFVGRLHSDFTMTGEWGDVPYQYEAPEYNAGELDFKVDFYDQGGTQWPYVHFVGQRGGYQIGATDWVLEASLAARTEFRGTYGYDPDPGCPWLEVDGDRYEIVEWQYPIAESGQIVGEGTQIIARPGDQLRVVAQVSPVLGFGDCQPSAMLVWDLQPLP